MTAARGGLQAVERAPGPNGAQPSLALPVGHSEEVTAVAYSSTGSFLLSGSYDGTARLWDLITGAPLRTFPHGGAVQGVAFSPDDSRVGTAGFDGAARIWDAASGALLHTLQQGNLVNAIAFTPDGKMVVTGGDAGARLWNAESGVSIRQLSGDTVKSVAISRTTGRVALGTAGGEITLLDLGGGGETRELRGHDAWVWSVAFSPNDTQLLSGGNDGTVRLWDAATGAPIRSMKARANVWSASFSRDGELVAAGSEGGGPEIWRARSGEPVRQMENPEPVHGVAFAPDGTLLAAVGEDKSIRLWSLADGKLSRELSAQPRLVGLVVPSPDRRFLYTADESGDARVWDLGAGSVVLQTTGRAGSPQGAGFSADGDVMLSVAADQKSVDVWSLSSLGRRSTLRVTGSRLRSCAISPDGGTVVTGDEEGSVRVWDVRSRRRTHELLGHTGPVNAVAWIEGTRLVLSGSDDGTARVWDVDAAAEVLRLSHDREVKFVAAAPNGRFLLTSIVWKDGDDEGTFLWGSDGRAIRKLTGTGPVAFGPDGASLFSVSGASVLLHDTASGSLIRKLKNNMAVEDLAVSRDGRFLLTADTGWTGRIWNVDRGEAIRVLGGGDDFSVGSVAWTWDGRYAVLTSGGSVRIVDPRSGRAVRAFSPVFDLDNVAVSATGIVCATAPGSVPRLWPVDGGAELSTFSFEQAEFEGIAVSRNADRMVSHGFGPFAFVWDIASGRQIRTLSVPDGVSAVALSPDERRVLTGSYAGKARIWDLDTGAAVRTLTDDECPANVVDWSSAGDRILAAGHNAVCVWEAESGRRLFRVAADLDITNAQFSPDGAVIFLSSGSAKRLRITDRRAAVVIDGRTGQKLGSLAINQSGVYAGAALPGRTAAAIANSDGTLSVLDWSLKRELARLVYLSARTWAAVSPTGHFDSNDIEGLQGLYWVFPDDPLRPLAPEVFVRDFFEPRMLQRVLDGEDLAAVSTSFADLNRVQPTVAIDAVDWVDATSGRARVTVKVGRACETRTTVGGPVTGCTDPYDVRLFRNGQLVGQEPPTLAEWPPQRRSGEDGRETDRERWRRLTHVEELETDGTRLLTFDVQMPRLPSLTSVTLTAYAFNLDRVKSVTAMKSVPMPVGLPPRKGKAYVITLGVNRTRSSPAWDLSYAVKDARDLAAAVAERLDPEQFTVLPPIVLVADQGPAEMDAGEATRGTLQTVLGCLSGRRSDVSCSAAPYLSRLEPAQPEDLVLLAISSHGYTDDKGIFHFVLADNDQGTEMTPALNEATLSSDQLSAWLANVDAGELLLIVDACHSETTMQANGFKPGPMGSSGLGQSAYDKGMRVLAASKAKEAAFERDDIENGVLTYTLARRGLYGGESDFQPEYGEITLGEWLGYAVREVPRLFREGERRGSVATAGRARDGFLGHGQTPTAYQQPVLFDFARSPLVVTLSPTPR